MRPLMDKLTYYFVEMALKYIQMTFWGCILQIRDQGIERNAEQIELDGLSVDNRRAPLHCRNCDAWMLASPPCASASVWGSPRRPITPHACGTEGGRDSTTKTYHVNQQFEYSQMKSTMGIWQGIGFAFAGLRYAFVSQRSIRIEIAFAGVVVIIGFVLGISNLEWAIVAISLVVGLELINTAVETVVDLASPTFHPLAKVAKDTAAAAVFIGAFGSLIAGLIIFLSRL